MKQIIHKLLPAESQTLADRRQVLTVCSTGTLDRQGDIVEPYGIDTVSFMKTGGPVLFGHDQNQPIGKALRIGVENGALQSLVQFPPAGVSARADEIYGLIRSGIVSSSSIGFRAKEWEPLGNSGRKYTKVELCEFSFVSVPANTDATIIARALGSKSGRILSAQNRAAVQALIGNLTRSEDCHAGALDMLSKADKHRSRALDRAAQLLANAGNSGDATDDADDDSGDPESNDELAFEARKRLVQIAARAPGISDLAAERRARIIKIAALAHSAA